MSKKTIKTIMNKNNNKLGFIIMDGTDYISNTDLTMYANPNNPSGVIRNWISNKNSFVFYSL